MVKPEQNDQKFKAFKGIADSFVIYSFVSIFEL